MKRLMLILVAAFAALFGAQAAFAQGNYDPKRNGVRAYTGNDKVGGAHPVAPQSWMLPLLPRDTVTTAKGSVGDPCDANGYPVNGSSRFRCLIVTSKTTGLTYSLQAKRIFVVENGKPVFYAAKTDSNGNDQIESLSPRAEQFAMAHGYRLENKTMVATAPSQAPAPPVAQAPQLTTCTGNAIQRNLCLAAAALAAANADKTTGVGAGVRP